MQLDLGTDTLKRSILFCTLSSLTFKLRYAEPKVEIISKSKGVSAAGWFNSQWSHLFKIPFESETHMTSFWH